MTRRASGDAGRECGESKSRPILYRPILYRHTSAGTAFQGPHGQPGKLLETSGQRLPQGSVLSPALFNLYTNDLPTTESRKFIYADDICCATQASSFAVLEKTLSADLVALEEYCKNWRLIPSTTKTVSSVFNLDNANAHRELNISLSGKRLRHESNPVYLGITLDRTLTYRDHLSKVAGKVKTRNN